MKKRKRELAKPSYYIYESRKVTIKSDVQIYKEQVTQISDIITEVLNSKVPTPGWLTAKRICEEVGSPISKVDFSYDEKTGKSEVQLSDNPID